MYSRETRRTRPPIIAVAIVVSCLATPALTTPVAAQAPDGDPLLGSGMGYFSIGVQNLDIGDLNRRLDGMGYPTFSRTVLVVGGGGYGRRPGGLILGGEGYGLIGGENAVDGRSVGLHGGYGLFNVGYAVDVLPELDVYPLVGFGGGGMSLAIGARGAPDSFDDVLEDPDRQARLNRGGLLLSIGGGLELRPGGGPRGIALGLRGGYIFEPSSSAWRLDGAALGAAPESSLSGLYLHVLIGGRK